VPVESDIVNILHHDIHCVVRNAMFLFMLTNQSNWSKQTFERPQFMFLLTY